MSKRRYAHDATVARDAYEQSDNPAPYEPPRPKPPPGQGPPRDVPMPDPTDDPMDEITGGPPRPPPAGGGGYANFLRASDGPRAGLQARGYPGC